MFEIRTQWFPNLLLALASAVFALLLAEGALRFTEHRYAFDKYKYGFPQGYFVADPEIGFTNASNFPPSRHYFRGPTYEIFTNELGCFDRPYEGESPLGIALGDSFAWGYAPLDKKWTSIAEKLAGLRLLKCGLTGSGTRQQHVLLQRMVAAGLRPNFVIVLYTGNDWNDDHFLSQETVIDGYRTSRLRSFDFSNGLLETRTDEQTQAIAMRILRENNENRSPDREEFFVAWGLFKKHVLPRFSSPPPRRKENIGSNGFFGQTSSS